MELSSFQWCSMTGQEVTDSLKHGMFHLNVKNRFCTVRVIKHWHRLPGEAVEYFHLADVKNLSR